MDSVMGKKTISKGLQLFTLIDVKILENVYANQQLMQPKTSEIQYVLMVIVVAKYQSKVVQLTRLQMVPKVRQILMWVS